MTYGDLRSLLINKHYIAAALVVDHVEALPVPNRLEWLVREIARDAPGTLLTETMRWALDHARAVWRKDSRFLAVDAYGKLVEEYATEDWCWDPPEVVWTNGYPCDCPLPRPDEHTDGPLICSHHTGVMGFVDNSGRGSGDINPRLTGVHHARCEDCELDFMPIGVAFTVLLDYEGDGWNVMGPEEAQAFCEQLLAASAAREKKQAQEEEE